MLRFVILAGALAIACPIAAQAQAQPAERPMVVTQGEAIVKRAPDRAWLSVSTQTRDARADRARTLSAEAMTAVQKALADAGVPSDAIRTTGYSLSPEMDWNDGRGVVRGYVVRNQIDVRIDDIERLPAIIDAANAARSTAISINGPRFDLKDQTAAEEEALKMAVAAAMTRARAIAEGAGRGLGEIVRIDDHATGLVPPPQPMMMRMSAEAADTATPISPGEVEIRAHVTVSVVLD
jgi:uncharacterized protein YggE